MAALAESDPEALWDDISNGRCVIDGYELEPVDVEVKRVERAGFAALTPSGVSLSPRISWTSLASRCSISISEPSSS